MILWIVDERALDGITLRDHLNTISEVQQVIVYSREDTLEQLQKSAPNILIINSGFDIQEISQLIQSVHAVHSDLLIAVLTDNEEAEITYLDAGAFLCINSQYSIPRITRIIQSIIISQMAREMPDLLKIKPNPCILKDQMENPNLEDHTGDENSKNIESSYKTLFEHCGAGILVIEEDMTISHMNRHASMQFGFQHEEIVGKRKWTDFVHSEDLPRMKAYHTMRRDNPDSAPSEYQFSTKTKAGGIRHIHLTITMIPGTKRSIASLIDISPYIQTQQIIEKKALVEEILADISGRFVNTPFEQFDYQVSETLKSIGKFVNADRSYIFIFNYNQGLMDNTHEWCSEGIQPEKENLQHLPLENFPFWLDNLTPHRVINVPRVSELPDTAAAEREILQSQGILSILAIPLVFEGKISGFLGFDSVRSVRIWAPDDIRLLQFASELLSNAFHNNIISTKLNQILANTQAILRAIPDYIFTINTGGFIEEAFTSKGQPFDDDPSIFSGRHIANTPLAPYIEGQLSAFDASIRSGKMNQTVVHVSFPQGDGIFEVRMVPLSDEKVMLICRDMTQEHRLQEQITQSEQQYHSLYTMMRLMCDNVPDFIWAKDLSGNYIFANFVMCKGFLLSDRYGDSVGKNETEIGEKERAAHPDDDSWYTFDRVCARSDAQVLKEKQISRFYEVGFIEGREIHLDVYKAPLLTPEGDMIGTVGCGREITQEKLLEKEREKAITALADSEKKFKNVVEASMDAIVLVDRAGTILEANTSAFRLFQYSKDHLLTKNIFDILSLDPEDVLSVKTCQIDGQNGCHSRVNATRSDLTIFPVEVRTGLVTLNEEKFQVIYISDITERKVAEDTIKAQQDLLRTILREMHLGMVLIDPHTHQIEEVNQMALALMGRSESEVIGKICHAFICPREVGNCPITEKGEVMDYAERPLLTAEGREMPVMKFATLISVNNQEHILETFLDIRPIREAEQALEKANHKLGILASITRHDILNLLSVIILTFEMYELGNHADKMPIYLDHSKKSIAAILKIIEFSRVYDDIGQFKPLWMNVSSQIFRAAESLSCQFIVLDESVQNLSIFGDALFEKVIYNLIDNALRHGKTLTEIRFSTVIVDKDIILICEDDGVGVPSDRKDRIFEKGVGENTGFGLFLSKEIIDITDMSIRETGIEGKGARFEIRIPAEKWRMETRINI